MYKVMLVGNVKIISQDLLNLIDWQEFDLKIVDIVNSEEEVLERFQKEFIDILITDIDVPETNGLDLVVKIKDLNYKTKFILISKYDNFSYAKKALEYGVDAYILKPIDRDEFKKTLERIVFKLKNYSLTENHILNKNRMLIQYINGKISDDAMSNIKKYTNIFDMDKNYTVAIITLINRNIKDPIFSLNRIIKNIFHDGYEIVHKHDGRVILINSWEKYIKEKDIKNCYEDMKDAIIDNLNEDIFVSIGDLVNDVKEIEVSYKIANALNKYMLTEGINICLDRHSLNYTEKYNLTFNKEIEKINKLIIKKSGDELLNYIDELFEDEKLNAKNIYDLSIKILFLINETLGEFKLNRKYKHDDLSNIIVALCNESTRQNVKSFVVSELNELLELMSDNTDKFSPVVQQVVRTLNEKYYEELSLKTLAQKYNVNSSYLGQIFAKEVGVSFSEYLSKIKNIKAKELILNTNMKINDIAKSVGYIDTSYFYRKFKKYFGVCPSIIRDMKKY